MVARGDLGVELPLEEVPIVQKRAIEIARQQAKPVIVATQVLESMVDNPRPTRAEASDAANAVLDGADAIMLSGETSVGAYPIRAVQTMAKIIESTEEHGLERIRPLGTRPHTMGGAVSAAAVEIGDLLGAKFLITFTQSGDTAKRMSRIRPRIPMLAFTPEPHTRSLLAEGRAQEGDLVILVAGSPPGIPGSTNALRVHKMGDAVNGVAPAYEDLNEL